MCFSSSIVRRQKNKRGDKKKFIATPQPFKKNSLEISIIRTCAYRKKRCFTLSNPPYPTSLTRGPNGAFFVSLTVPHKPQVGDKVLFPIHYIFNKRPLLPPLPRQEKKGGQACGIFFLHLLNVMMVMMMYARMSSQHPQKKNPSSPPSGGRARRCQIYTVYDNNDKHVHTTHAVSGHKPRRIIQSGEYST